MKPLLLLSFLLLAFTYDTHAAYKVTCGLKSESGQVFIASDDEGTREVRRKARHQLLSGRAPHKLFAARRLVNRGIGLTFGGAAVFAIGFLLIPSLGIAAIGVIGAGVILFGIGLLHFLVAGCLWARYGKYWRHRKD